MGKLRRKVSQPPLDYYTGGHSNKSRICWDVSTDYTCADISKKGPARPRALSELSILRLTRVGPSVLVRHWQHDAGVVVEILEGWARCLDDLPRRCRMALRRWHWPRRRHRRRRRLHHGKSRGVAASTDNPGEVVPPRVASVLHLSRTNPRNGVARRAQWDVTRESVRKDGPPYATKIFKIALLGV